MTKTLQNINNYVEKNRHKPGAVEKGIKIYDETKLINES
jgi:hypothetical protein